MKSFISSNRSALTLVEILIVIAIVAILAALVVPRILMPRERVLALEAQELLNLIRLSQINVRDRGSAPGWTLAISYEEGEPPDAGWNILGMKPLAQNAPFRYRCYPNRGTCTATRQGLNTEPKFGAAITIDLEPGDFHCGPPYTALSGSGNSTVCG